MNLDTDYIGDELELFSHAKRWKAYWGSKIRPYLGTTVLEVGAGIGSNTQFLMSQGSTVKHWVCLEPDAKLSCQIYDNLDAGQLPLVEVSTEYLSDFKSDLKFDSILYIDVIEHIEKDVEELRLATSFLKAGGYLIILVPAHQFLFSDFDKAIGHYRRYNKSMLQHAVGSDLQLERLVYLDSMGICASTVNKLFLKQTYPSLKQIRFWDSVIVRMSQFTDVLSGYRLGKSLLGVWKN
jgi:2-polyprenyl-3-methyl-5-hydroxy-6-metoxy-1,4-benzoquinol methylase